ncbi:hypothetical protein IV203_019242 [Nitzschia inconspicua]|uniref:Uncharacterized protein n=1 Tax=Nitzschia inconspicua TaxID=303405 RepID=A0A9K3LYU1_9STRA|nr:hypothetical protein IV203_019242 [Nitzschia inconspicua]
MVRPTDATSRRKRNVRRPTTNNNNAVRFLVGLLPLLLEDSVSVASGQNSSLQTNGNRPTQRASVLWRLEHKSDGTTAKETTYRGGSLSLDKAVTTSTTVDPILLNAAFTDFVIPPPMYNTNNVGYVLLRNPVGFQVVNLRDGVSGDVFVVQQGNDVSIDAYVYSPTSEIFTFLIGNIDGPGYGRIAAHTRRGNALWTLSNALDTTSPLPGWNWDPDVVTPILSHDNTTVFINFISETVSIAAFDLLTGDVVWNISNLEDDPVIIEKDFDVPPRAALGGLALAGSSGILAGLYDRDSINPRSGASSSFNSGLLRINAMNGTVDTDSSWIYDQTLCFGRYQGGIRGAPAMGFANVYASDQFWGQLAWSQRNLTTLVYNKQLQNEYTPSPLVLNEDRSIMLGMRNQLYPSGYIPRTGLLIWTTRTTRLQCNTKAVSRNPPPVVDRDVAYFSCGTTWYGFWAKNGTLYKYGNATVASNGEQGIFISLSVVDGIVYTTEIFESRALSFVTAWDARQAVDIDEQQTSEAPSMTDEESVEGTDSTPLSSSPKAPIPRIRLHALLALAPLAFVF